LSKKSLVIAVVLIFALIATAMAFENKNAADNFQSNEYLNAKSIESTTAIAFSNEFDEITNEDIDSNESGRRVLFFEKLQPVSIDLN
jgi:hypothetical protein